VLALEPIGANLTWRLQWTVAVEILQCGSERGEPGRLIEYVYGYDWDIDEEGYFTRTIGGYLEIAASSNGSGTTLDQKSADVIGAKYVRFPALDSFTRVQQFSLSEDHKRLSFTITDTENNSPHPYSKGIIKPQVEFSISSTDTMGFLTWEASLSGTIRYAKGYDWETAWNAFVLILNSRRQRSISASYYLITKRISIRESIFDRSISFSVSWELIKLPDNTGQQNINLKILEASNFGNIPGDTPAPTWAQWAQSHRQIRDPTLVAKAFQNSINDKIVNQCNSVPPQGSMEEPGKFRTPFTSIGVNGKKCPPKRYSIPPGKCQLTVEVFRTDDAIVLKRLAGSSEAKRLAEEQKVINANGIQISGVTQDNPNEAHYRAPPNYFIVLKLNAFRYGYELPLPEILDLGGSKPIPLQKLARQKVRGADGPCPVYHATHIVTYQLRQAYTDEVIRNLTVNPEYQGCLNHLLGGAGNNIGNNNNNN